MPGIQDINPYVAAADAITNPLFAHLTNVKNRKFTREMYKTQRQDALSDWAMQNEYNSPRSQMQRFQEAGLNPNLIYGGLTEVGGVRSSSSSGGQAEAPKAEAGKSLASIYSMQQTKAQTDLLAKQMNNIEAETELKKMQSLATLAGTELSKVQKDQIAQNMGFQSQLFPVDLESKKTGVERQKQEITTAWNEDLRRTISTMWNSAEAAERIASLVKGREKTQADIDKIKQEIELMKKDGTLRDYDIKWRESKHNPGDPSVVKIYDEILDRLGLSDVPKLNLRKNFNDWRDGKSKPYNWKSSGTGRPSLRATDSQ